MPPDDMFDILKAIEEESAAIARMQAQPEDLFRTIPHKDYTEGNKISVCQPFYIVKETITNTPKF